MQVKIIFDIEENQYICFVSGINSVTGFGDTEADAVHDFLKQCENHKLYNQKVINQLLQQFQ